MQKHFITVDISEAQCTYINMKKLITDEYFFSIYTKSWKLEIKTIQSMAYVNLTDKSTSMNKNEEAWKN